MRPDDLIDTCRSSHRSFVADVAGLTDDEYRASSLLPGFSRAHVVAHVINKTEAHVRLFEGSPDEILRLHPVGHDADAAAALGARRSSAACCAAVTSWFDRLERAWDALDDSGWERHAIMTAGPRTMAEVVAHHLRNVEVHHVDLDIGYGPPDWPPRFVEGELDRRLHDLAGRADHADLLAWLLGRAPVPDLGPW